MPWNECGSFGIGGRVETAASIPTRTLDRLLLDLEQLGDELPQGGVLVIDEAGMAATRPTGCLRRRSGRGVRHAARYRAQYDITDPADALGPWPEWRGGQQRDWERAHEAMERAERRLGREVANMCGVDLGIGL